MLLRVWLLLLFLQKVFSPVNMRRCCSASSLCWIQGLMSFLSVCIDFSSLWSFLIGELLLRSTRFGNFTPFVLQPWADLHSADKRHVVASVLNSGDQEASSCRLSRDLSERRDDGILPMIPSACVFCRYDDVDVWFFSSRLLWLNLVGVSGAGGRRRSRSVQPGDKISLKSCPQAAAEWFISR